MKRRVNLLIVAGLMLGASGVHADSISPIPLMVCTNGITQVYNGLTTADTLARIDYDIHTNSTCGAYDNTVNGSTGSLNLASGTSSFQLCYSTSAGGLPQEVCDTTGCSDTTCSFLVRQLNSTASGNAFGTGDCVSVVCSGGSPTSWSLQAAGTLSFP